MPHRGGITQYFVFCNWLISIAIMSSRFLRGVAGVRISLLFVVGQHSEIHFLKVYLFCFWLCSGLGHRVWAFSSCGEQGSSLLPCVNVSVQWLLVKHVGFRSCSARAQWLWDTGLVTLRHVGSSQARVEPVSLALQGGFLTTGPPGEPWMTFMLCLDHVLLIPSFVSGHLGCFCILANCE